MFRCVQFNKVLFIYWKEQRADFFIFLFLFLLCNSVPKLNWNGKCAFSKTWTCTNLRVKDRIFFFWSCFLFFFVVFYTGAHKSFKCGVQEKAIFTTNEPPKKVAHLIKTDGTNLFFLNAQIRYFRQMQPIFCLSPWDPLSFLISFPHHHRGPYWVFHFKGNFLMRWL